jgi:GNAT superfamily N-acetyltransferase
MRPSHSSTEIIDEEVSEADATAVVAGLRAFNEARLGPGNELPVRFVVRGPDGSVLGGVLGHTKWKWMYIAKLWVDDSVRGKGFGTRLMNAAEDLARQRGCIGVVLDTFEYQARPFYERLGYTLFGTLEGYPPGYRQFYLSKPL